MSALEPVFLSCAVTGGMSVPGQSPAIPVTPEQIIDSAVGAHEARAAIVHLHVREPDTGKPVADLGLFEEVLSGIAERCDAIVQPTSGGGVGMTIEERARVVTDRRPEMATFNCGSFNFGIFGVHHRPEMADWEIDYLESTRDYVFRNTFRDLYRLSELFREAGTKPEYEVYDVGHLYNLHHLASRASSTSPFTSSSCWACWAPTPLRSSSCYTCGGRRSRCSERTSSPGGGGGGLPGPVPPGRHRADAGRPHARGAGQPARERR